MEFIKSDISTLTNEINLDSSVLYYDFKDNTPRPFILMFPGGGYAKVTGEKEGGTICRWANTQGFHAGVYAYQTNPADYKVFLKEIQEINDFLLAQENITSVYVMGFSAGAHLSGLFAEKVTPKPKGAIYCYPVVTLEKDFAHQPSAERFLGKDLNEENLKNYSLENLITPTSSPAFIWQTGQDQAVPVANSLTLALAYAKAGVPFEYHEFPEGPHGLGMQKDFPHTFQWVSLLENWLKLQEEN